MAINPVNGSGNRLRPLQTIPLGILGTLFIWWWYALPDPLFDAPCSTILLDQDNHLMSARIAADQQWRFAEIDSVPQYFIDALLTFEDKRFMQHPGVDLLAMSRALCTNLRAGHIVSGGSTLTMQLIRISRKGQARSLRQKAIEILLAIRAELRYSKSEILRLYASHAPFGGNVVGLEAASWRYFGKPPALLSRAEATCLAVLPNSPALIHPGRGREVLLAKRNRVLMALSSNGTIDSIELALSILEPLPDAPLPLPDAAPHALHFLAQAGSPRIHSTLNAQLQKEVTYTLASHHAVLAQNGIHNGAVLVLDTKTGAVLAYVGNVRDFRMQHENAVDMIQAERSSGSLLKPLLYASAFHSGQLLPRMLIEDVPVQFNGYQPENFTRTYTGMIPADEALIRSLNVPAVNQLKAYGLEKFRLELQEAGLHTIRQSSEYYGLPLILGGAEVTLWDICGVYASMGRMLTHATTLNNRYDQSDLHGPIAIVAGLSPGPPQIGKQPLLWDYGALWWTLESMRNLSRPAEDGQWERFQSEKPIAWKTGTSFGFRDAWAVGVTPDYTVGVWIGNADGEGRPGLIGARAAAPILFDVFRNLPGDNWWSPPYDNLVEAPVCRESGFIAGPDCPNPEQQQVPEAGIQSGPCPFHQTILTDTEGRYRYHRNCIEIDDSTILPAAVFILPPAAAGYYQRNHPVDLQLPPLHPGCAGAGQALAQMEFIYPRHHTKIFVPRELNGNESRAVFKAAHRKQEAEVYWYLDNTFLGATREFHTMEINTTPGQHKVTLVDGTGETIERLFEVVGSE